MLDYMTKRYLNVEMYFILNSELSDGINASVYTICDHYKVPVITLHDIEKKAGHPSVAGMKAIAEQVDAFVRPGNVQKIQTAVTKIGESIKQAKPSKKKKK
jgi:hypothetical protein